jgi:hypothetical protein
MSARGVEVEHRSSTLKYFVEAVLLFRERRRRRFVFVDFVKLFYLSKL